MPDSAQSSHPGMGQLAAYALGKLAGEELAAVKVHLNGCHACQKALKSLPKSSGGDESVRGRETLTPAGFVRAGPAASGGIDQVSVLPALGTTAAYRPESDVPADLANHPKFEILQLLGQGGMGAVYKARHKVMNRLVALKVINPKLVGNAHSVQRFHREVQAAAKLHHPNIVTAYDADKAGDTHFLVMEFVEGIDLAKLVQKQGPVSVAHACHFIRQAALGLQHAHEHGMVHRDIKPHNMMLAPGNVVKVMDFGLARLGRDGAGDGGLTGENVLMGTADYVAPEQAQDAHRADIRADIYSLGCSLYFLLSGRAPFAGGSVVQKIAAHLMTAVPLAELPATTPESLRRVVAKMVEKDPANRYQTPAEVAQAMLPPMNKPTRPRHEMPTAPIADAGSGEPSPDAARRSAVNDAEIPAPQPSDPVRQEPGAARRSAVGDDEPRAAPASDPVRQAGLRALAVALVLAVTLVVALSLAVRHSLREGPSRPLRAKSSLDSEGVPHRLANAEGGNRDPGTPGEKRQKSAPGKVEAPREEVSRITKDGQGKEATVAAPSAGKPGPGTQAPSGQEERTLRGHSEMLSAVAFSPDGTRLASCSGDWYGTIKPCEIKFWDVSTGQQVREIRSQSYGFTALTFDAAGTRLASTSWDKTARIWNVHTGEAMHVFPGGGYSVTFSPDGTRLLRGVGSEVLVSDVQTGQRLPSFRGHKARIWRLAFSPDGGRLASASEDKTVKVWDRNGRELFTFNEAGGGVAFSPDGKLLASGGFDFEHEDLPRDVKVWNATTREQIRNLKGHTGFVWTVAFSPDGTRLASAGKDRTVRIWDVRTGRECLVLCGHTGTIMGIAFSPDGTRLASGSMDKTVKIWDVRVVGR